MKYKIWLQKKNDEQPELNKRSYWKIFLGYIFIGEGEDLGEPDSSSDEDNDEQSIANEEEIETNLQEADFETPETMDVYEGEVQESLSRKQKFKNLNKVVSEKNYDELPQQKMFQKTMETKDKKFRIKYTTNKPVNQLNKTPSQNILKHDLVQDWLLNAHQHL